MKRKIIFSIAIIGLILSISATLDLTRIIDGIRVGSPKKIIYANELKTLSGIDTTKQTALNIANAVDEIFVASRTLESKAAFMLSVAVDKSGTMNTL